MRPKLNKVKWKAIHIAITIIEPDFQDVASSRNNKMSREDFFSKVVDYLSDKGYIPRIPVSQMKITFKSPYSNSEYYTFLKIENNDRIKVVLDIRLTDHYHENWGKHSERERHLYHMKQYEFPKIQQEFGLDTTTSDAEFFDVADQSSVHFELIDIDGSLFTSYDDALIEMEHKIDNLP